MVIVRRRHHVVVTVVIVVAIAWSRRHCHRHRYSFPLVKSGFFSRIRSTSSYICMRIWFAKKCTYISEVLLEKQFNKKSYIRWVAVLTAPPENMFSDVICCVLHIDLCWGVEKAYVWERVAAAAAIVSRQLFIVDYDCVEIWYWVTRGATCVSSLKRTQLQNLLTPFVLLCWSPVNRYYSI